MSIREGDWVTATESLVYGLLGGSTIKAGTRVVVTNVANGWFNSTASVRWDGGFGTVSTTVPTRHLRVVRHGGGVDRFVSHQGRLTAARAALALFLIWPVIKWVVEYVWLNKGFSGITGAFALGMVDSIDGWITMLVASPVHAVIYFAFLGLIGRWAWR